MLIVVNTWKRAKILAETIATLNATRRPDSCLAVLDDATEDWVAPEGVDHVWQLDAHSGAGAARYEALLRCRESSHEVFLVMDNDVQVSPGFDTEALDLWFAHRGRHPKCLGTPFHPALLHHTEREFDFGEYLFGTSCSGAMLFMDRSMVNHILWTMPRNLWDSMWDWTLGGYVGGFVKPKKSYATHVGHDEDALHP